MAKPKCPNKAPDREKKWNKVFNAVVKLLQNQQKDRQLLEDKIKSLLGDNYKMKMELKVRSAKSEFMMGLKQREASIYKRRYEHTEDELADFREWFDYLSQKCSEPKDISDDISNKGEGSKNKALQEEVRKLKSEIEKCKLEKNSEISALLAEKDFVWNQFKKMDSDLTTQLRMKCDEVQHANEKVQVLVNRVEELQISNEKLRTEVAKVESESVQKNDEIFRLKKEIDLLKSRSASVTPLLRPCRAEASHRRGNNSTTDGTLNKKSDPSQTVEKLQMSHTKRSAHKSTGGKAPRKQFITKGSSSSKRKLDDDDDIPKLFTSSFKVPKLKSSSSPKMV